MATPGYESAWVGLEWVVTHLLLEGSASAWTSPRHERLTFLVADGVCALKPTRNFGSIRSETALAKGKATFCILPQSSEVECCHGDLVQRDACWWMVGQGWVFMTPPPWIVVVALAAVVLLLRHQYLCLRSLDTYQVVVREGKERVGRDFHTVTLHRSVAGTEPTNLAQTIATTVVMVATTSIGWSKATWLLVGRKEPDMVYSL